MNFQAISQFNKWRGKTRSQSLKSREWKAKEVVLRKNSANKTERTRFYGFWPMLVSKKNENARLFCTWHWGVLIYKSVSDLYVTIVQPRDMNIRGRVTFSGQISFLFVLHASKTVPLISLYFKRKQRRKYRNQREQFLAHAKQTKKNFDQVKVALPKIQGESKKGFNLHFWHHPNYLEWKYLCNTNNRQRTITEQVLKICGYAAGILVAIPICTTRTHFLLAHTHTLTAPLPHTFISLIYIDHPFPINPYLAS